MTTFICVSVGSRNRLLLVAPKIRLIGDRRRSPKSNFQGNAEDMSLKIRFHITATSPIEQCVNDCWALPHTFVRQMYFQDSLYCSMRILDMCSMSCHTQHIKIPISPFNAVTLCTHTHTYIYTSNEQKFMAQCFFGGVVVSTEIYRFAFGTFKGGKHVFQYFLFHFHKQTTAKVCTIVLSYWHACEKRAKRRSSNYFQRKMQQWMTNRKS